jgi:hypothetical protein
MKETVTVRLPDDHELLKAGEARWIVTFQKLRDSQRYKILCNREDKNDGEFRTIDLFTSDTMLKPAKDGGQREVLLRKIQEFLESGVKKETIEHLG